MFLESINIKFIMGCINTIIGFATVFVCFFFLRHIFKQIKGIFNL